MLPIDEIIPGLCQALETQTRIVVMAPPGAGKTTRVPLALLEASWSEGRKIVMLEPRRLAVRAAASRMAESLGERVGDTVGLIMRGEVKTSKSSRLIIETEGVLTRQLLDDPALEDVGCVIFDEFHERSLDADIGLAFCLECQALLRPDLRIIVMSATLDGTKIADLMQPCALFQSEGRTYPITTHYLGRDPILGLEADIARQGVRLSTKLKTQAQAQAQGGATGLIFLPGQAEIHRTASRLEDLGLPDGVEIQKLFGAMDFEEQKRILAPLNTGQARWVLATSIAETSLTIDGVTMVIDSGQSRVIRFDAARGQSRTVTERVTKASADQRRGRCGRTQAGDCYRLWDEPQDRSLIAFGRPEILETDLTSLYLTLKLWGHADTSTLALLDHPPGGAWVEANRVLESLGAIDEVGQLTPMGKTMGDFPLSPRLSAMILKAYSLGQSHMAARIAVLLSEPDLGGKSTDLDLRLEGLERDKSSRAMNLKSQAHKWVKVAEKEAGMVESFRGLKSLNAAQCLSLAFPERIAMNGAGEGQFVMANGRGAYVDPHDPLAKASFLAIGDLGGGAARDRVLLAATLMRDDIIALWQDQIDTRHVIFEQGDRLKAQEITHFHSVTINVKFLPHVPAELMAKHQKDRLINQGIQALNIGEAFENLRARIRLASEIDPDQAWPDVSDMALLNSIDQWLSPGLGTAYSQISEVNLNESLKAWLGYVLMQHLDMIAPEMLTLPMGNRVRIEYEAEGGPIVEVRVQELFGVKSHPRIGKGTVPLILSLLSPARRPIQITRDLPAFWKGSWAEVRKDMRGRYPRHPWPEDPENAPPTQRVKPLGT